MISVKNIYYMLSYAFHVLNEQGYKSIETEKFDNVGELCAAILVKGMTMQIKRGLGRDYVSVQEPLSSLRGRLEISESIKTQTVLKKQMICTYDEFSVDSYMNRIIKTTMLLLLRSDISKARKKELRNILMYLGDVGTLDIYTINWHLQYNRNNQTYQMLISICYLVVKGLLQTKSDGTTKLMDFLDDKQMSWLYEKFVLEYYRREIPELNAATPHIQWALDDGIGTMLPDIRTDITLSYKNIILIIDTKYYSSTTQIRYDTRMVHSHNIYQIFAYVKNKEAELANVPHKVSGMLLYARTDEETQPDQSYQMSGNRIDVKTLDLNCDFFKIKKQLNAIAKEFFGITINQKV